LGANPDLCRLVLRLRRRYRERRSSQRSTENIASGDHQFILPDFRAG
jgi:hypothetical protein